MRTILYLMDLNPNFVDRIKVNHNRCHGMGSLFIVEKKKKNMGCHFRPVVVKILIVTLTRPKRQSYGHIFEIIFHIKLIKLGWICGRHQLKGLGYWTEAKRESGLSTTSHLCVSASSLRYRMTCPPFLLPWFLHHDKLHYKAVSQNKPFLY